jgi:hypothetical protein
MARRTLQKIKPLHPELVAPKGAKLVGMTPDGRQIWEEIRKVAITEWVVDADGKQEYKKNIMTGEPLIPVRKVRSIVDKVMTYTLESEGNGNLRRVDWIPPSPEELERSRHAKAVTDMQVAIAEALVNAKVGPDELLRFLGVETGNAAPAEPAEERAEPASEAEGDQKYPYMASPGRWMLSNGSIIQGKKKDAIKAEKSITDEERQAWAAAQAQSDQVEGY